MKFPKFRVVAAIAASFTAGCLLTSRIDSVRAQSARVFELRVYHAPPGKLADLEARFRDHTLDIFKKHNMTSIGYWVPQDADKGHDNTLIYVLAHESRESARKNWGEFARDPEWQSVSKASEANGKIVDKVDSTFMDAADFSPMK